jgi:YafQ family addiction module toxin component
MYDAIVDKKVDKTFDKLSRKDPILFKQLENKVGEILENPHHFKPLRGNLKNKRRVHVGSFVLIFEIDEMNKTVKFLVFVHHDEAYL